MKLTVENASFAYSKNTPVLNNLCFSAESGELLAILGPNGAGKTTLLRCIMGFLRWHTGRSLLDGEDIRSMSSRKLWQRISYVPQARGAFTSLGVRDMILLGRTNRIGVFSAPGDKDIAQVDLLAEQLGIGKLLAKKCSEISGGELQMTLIARALAADPELLILDEPESNLDFKNQLIVLNTMSKLVAEGLCCIFNTHYPTHALMRATKSLILQKGGEAFFGDTPTVVTEENIRRAFGVQAVISQIETPGNILKNITPLGLVQNTPLPNPSLREAPAGANLIAVISLIVTEATAGVRINELLHVYRDCIIGRMGMPYKKSGLHIINLTLDAPEIEINALAHKLSILPGVSVKTVFAQE